MALQAFWRFTDTESSPSPDVRYAELSRKSSKATGRTLVHRTISIKDNFRAALPFVVRKFFDSNGASSTDQPPCISVNEYVSEDRASCSLVVHSVSESYGTLVTEHRELRPHPSRADVTVYIQQGQVGAADSCSVFRKPVRATAHRFARDSMLAQMKLFAAFIASMYPGAVWSITAGGSDDDSI